MRKLKNTAYFSRAYAVREFFYSPLPHIFVLFFISFSKGKQGVVYVHTNIEERACDLAVYIIENKSTVRAAAKQFGVSKSTVHKDLTERLRTVNPALYRQVRELLDINKAERHIRGGMATRRKYKGE